MQVIVLTNEKPTSCETCLFYNEALATTEEMVDNELPKIFEITKECFLTHAAEDPFKTCPLVEISNSIVYEHDSENFN